MGSYPEEAALIYSDRSKRLNPAELGEKDAKNSICTASVDWQDSSGSSSSVSPLPHPVHSFDVSEPRQ